MMSTRVVALTLGGLIAVLSPVARAVTYNFEVRLLTGENAFARHVWGACTECTPEQFEALVPPPGYMKSGARVNLMAGVFVDYPPVPDPLPQDLDLVPEIPGPDFTYIARVLDGEILTIDAEAGVLALADVRRDTFFRYEAGQAVHEVTDLDGNVYVAANLDIDLAANCSFPE